jgi:hypothetical protein
VIFLPNDVGENGWAIYQKTRWAVAPIESSFAVINLIHCRLTPTQPFSERLPTPKGCDISSQ